MKPTNAFGPYLLAIGVVSVALIVFSASAQASVTWDIVGTTASGEPDLFGTVTTPDIPVSCSLGPPASCPISGTLTIPADALGGPGTTIDLGVDPANVIISISKSPPAAGDDFFVFDISKDSYECTTSSSLVLQCDFNLTTASYELVLTEQVPKVVIGNGNVLISGQLEVAGQIIGPAEPTSYSIGDTGPAGGWVFYLTTDGLNGLEAAPEDQAAAARWGCQLTDIPGAEGTAVGTGESNTEDINDPVSGCSEAGIAAALAAAYVSPSGHFDWYMPSKDELYLMRDNLHNQDPPLAGLASGDYWSSSENSGGGAWGQSFSGGVQYVDGKNATYRVRAVRAF